jgi:hypothetical protein
VKRSGSIAVLVCLAALVPGASGAAAATTSNKTLTRSEGQVTATLSWRQSADRFGNAAFSGLRLMIQRAGAVVYDQPVASSECEPCALEDFKGAPPKLEVVDLEGNGEPVVLLRLYTGGAHCCSVVQLLRFDASAGAYQLTQHDFGDPTPRVADVAGDYRLELESADDRFAYEFTSYAYSGLPIQIWRFSQGRLIDVTRQFPAAVRADAKTQWGRFLAQRRHGFGLGFVAAWAADEQLLGHGAAVARTLAREAHAHNLRSADRLSRGGPAFVAKLKRFLRKTGYAAPP